MVVTDLITRTVTSVLTTQPRMNTEIVTVIGSGRVLHAISSYIKDHVTQSVTGIKDVLAQHHMTVTHVISMHSRITTVNANVTHTGLELTVELTYTQDIVMLSVTVTVSAQRQPTASNAYPILIVMATQLASATSTGPEMIVAYVSTGKPVTQFVTTVMVV